MPRGHGTLGERRKVVSAQGDGRTVLDIDAGDALQDKYGFAFRQGPGFATRRG